MAAEAGSAQEQWLRTDLEAAITAPCTLAYWHHARFSSGANHGNDARTDALFRALYEYGTDVVITGHDHIYERFAPQDPNAQPDPTGIREFVVGTGGAGLTGIGTIRANSEVRSGAPNGAHGVLKLTLKEGNYDWEFIPIAGQMFRDTGNAACVGATLNPTPPPLSLLPPAVTCNGLLATIVGTFSNDRLFGTPGNDVIHRWGGNDRKGPTTTLNEKATFRAILDRKDISFLYVEFRPKAVYFYYP